MLPVRSNENAPKSLPIVTPDRPSAPPVIDGIWFAASNSISPMPSVTISRARSAPRTTRKLVAKPTSAPAAPATTSPLNGSPQPCTASRPAAYAPMPKNAACPSDTMPA